ncbi:MAG: Flp pilus assembly protein CpaB [Candidatus Omnitrophota bacterium]
MPKQKIILLAGVGLAIISVFMIKVYLDQQRQIMRDQANKALKQIRSNQTAVLVAKRDIKKGEAIDTNMLFSEIIPNKYVEPQAATSLDRIAGMITVASIPKGSQITLGKLVSEHKARGGSLASSTPVGKRAITLSVDDISSLVGMIKPGDKVDIIGIVPVPMQLAQGKQVTQLAVIPLFQDVLILAVGQETGTVSETTEDARARYAKQKEKETEISQFITVALAPQEANLIAFVQDQGKIRLILRSPADSKVEAIPPASWDTLFQYVMPKQPEPVIEEPKGPVVEIYRGGQKETVIISQ